MREDGEAPPSKVVAHVRSLHPRAAEVRRLVVRGDGEGDEDGEREVATPPSQRPRLRLAAEPRRRGAPRRRAVERGPARGGGGGRVVLVRGAGARDHGGAAGPGGRRDAGERGVAGCAARGASRRRTAAARADRDGRRGRGRGRASGRRGPRGEAARTRRAAPSRRRRARRSARRGRREHPEDRVRARSGVAADGAERPVTWRFKRCRFIRLEAAPRDGRPAARHFSNLSYT